MEDVDLETFLKEMIKALNERLEEQDRKIRELKKQMNSIGKREINIDRSVLKVLKGK
jgi:hypothetical protein